MQKTRQKFFFLKKEKEGGEAHLLGEIILQLRNKQDQHDDATDDGHCRDTWREGLLEMPWIKRSPKKARKINNF